ncbi:MAG TPA: nucleoside phosphorylase [Eubacteriales bacterium]|nr:nucleoside phosphorylase [Eubacteriales bacterium]
MRKSDEIREKPSIRQIQSDYGYYDNVPPRGFFINGRPALTQIDPEKAGDYVIVLVRDALCAYGDDPAKVVADRLENAELIGQSGMYTSYSGWYRGAHITAVSGGSGAPEMEMILYDYLEFTDASTFIRLGGSGGFGDNVNPGDLVISSGAVRDEGMTRAYIDAGYPAAAHYEVVLAMVQAAEEIGHPYHVGVTVSCDSDYVGGGRPGVGGYLQPRNIEHAAVYNRAGCLNGDRESSAIITLSALFGRRGGSVCSVSDNLCTGKRFTEGIGHNFALDVVLNGCAILHKMDLQKGGREHWYPGLMEKE